VNAATTAVIKTNMTFSGIRVETALIAIGALGLSLATMTQAVWPGQNHPFTKTTIQHGQPPPISAR
jgi:hypothetical protein